MEYVCVTLKGPMVAKEAMSAVLLELGAKGVEIIDPMEIASYIKELDVMEYADESLLPDDIAHCIVKAYFYEELTKDILKEKVSDAENIISKAFGGISIEANFALVNDEDWANNWKKYYHPFEIGDNIAICPTWERDTYKSDRKTVYLDPGMAFGTGEHETTFMCATMLDGCFKKDMQLLDIGTGSGVLSIVAAKLGAFKIRALDIDQVAVKTAIENFSYNGVLDKISISRSEISMIESDKFDVVVANIVASVLIDIRDEVADRLKQKGLIILSGIIKDKEADVLKAYNEIGFEVKERMVMKEWVALKLSRKAGR